MRKSDRILLYVVLVLALGAWLRPWLPGVGTAVAAPGAGGFAEPAAAKVALCDIYVIVEKLMQCEKYLPLREAEQKRLQEEVGPPQDELQAMQVALQGQDMSKPENQAKVKEFQEKRTKFDALREKLAGEFTEFVGKQFVQAFRDARASATTIAKAGGYTYVASVRLDDNAMSTTDPQQLLLSLLARPVVMNPDGTDITDKVLDDLKLPKGAAVPPAPAGDAGGAPAATPAAGEKPKP